MALRSRKRPMLDISDIPRTDTKQIVVLSSFLEEACWLSLAFSSLFWGTPSRVLYSAP